MINTQLKISFHVKELTGNLNRIYFPHNKKTKLLNLYSNIRVLVLSISFIVVNRLINNSQLANYLKTFFVQEQKK